MLAAVTAFLSYNTEDGHHMTTIITMDGTNIFDKDWGSKDAQPIVTPSRLVTVVRRLGQPDNAIHIGPLTGGTSSSAMSPGQNRVHLTRR